MKRFTKVLLGAASAAVLATAVHAADAVVYEQAPEAVEVVTGYDWSGFYAGLHAGYAWAGRDWDPDGGDDDGAFEYDMRGALAGAQIGYNWQINNFVFGVEADAAWSDARDTVSEFGGFVTAEAEMRWLATVRGRVGYAWDRFLVYGTGGAAFAGVDTEVNFLFGGGDSASATHTGWAAGLGVEAMGSPKKLVSRLSIYTLILMTRSSTISMTTSKEVLTSTLTPCALA